MKKVLKRFRLFITVIALLSGIVGSVASACTSAIIGAKASRSGRPLLWKHRDTSNIDNMIAYVAPEAGAFGYVGLYNADDRKLEQVWIGMNDVGFAVMNTASYNIKDDNVPEKKMDREGFLMSAALKTCRTVDDFERFLADYPRPMGVEANFGVIDATGTGAYFETNNHSFVRFDLRDSENDIIIRTNYSHSGRPNEGYGFVREDNAEFLIDSVARAGDVTPEFLTEKVSRSFYHSLKKRDYAMGEDRWVIDQDFIPRYKSTATIVIEGCRPVADAMTIVSGSLKEEYIMWTGLGYPPCSEIYPVWCSRDGVDAELLGTGAAGHSAAADRAKARRAEVFPIHKGNGDKYIDMLTLYNAGGTGFVQTLVPQNAKVYDFFTRRRDLISDCGGYVIPVDAVMLTDMMR